MKHNFYILTLILLFIGSSQLAWASHLRAGEITARRISLTSATYEIKLTTYTDEINGKAANDGQETVFFFFGGAIPPLEVKRKSKIQISVSTIVNTYIDTVTFPAPGNYIISCGIPMRNKNTLNLPSPSDEITFFVQSVISVNAQFGLNSTPSLLNIPVDSAAVGIRFIHNPGAFDVDGDSLSYGLRVCLEDKRDGTGVGIEIPGYRPPEEIGTQPILNEAGSGPATLRIDARTGDLIWDAPQVAGQYNVAFVIYEWRKGLDGNFIKIGEIVRDMQIIVVETKNKRPKLIVPADVCVEAGETVQFVVTAEDVDSTQFLKISSSGGVFNVDQSGQYIPNIAEKAATIAPYNVLQKSPAKVTFNWETNCKHIRQQQYGVLFKVEDFPGRFQTQLTDLKTVNIKVLPPRPKGLVVKESEKGNVLTWKPNTNCGSEGEVIIYRKDGCSGLIAEICTTGMPLSWGYEEIARIALSDSTFTDSKVTKGSIYSYRIVTNIVLNTFTSMESAPSAEACIGSTLPDRVPIITNVTVDKTSTTTGEITVKWTKPIKLDTALYEGGYKYVVYRAEGLNGTDFIKIAEIPTKLNQQPDTIFVDKNLNTTDKAYRYQIEFYFQNNRSMGRTPPASSVWLLIAPNDKQTYLRWEANVPWSNDNQKHRIYREVKPNVFNIIAEVSVTSNNTYVYTDTGQDNYTDDGNYSIGLKNDTTYCYKVETVGTYEQVPELGKLANLSQIFCATPADRSPPCVPTLSINPIDCATVSTEDFCNPQFLQNKLTWLAPFAAGCRKDITQYRLYYARFEQDTPQYLTSIDANLPNTYIHQRDTKNGFAGCYYITAVSSLGVESNPSNKVCKDNCALLKFPTVFTPNNDNLNDTFTPMNCAAFIKSATITVYNRYGAKVFSAIDALAISWDGTNETGQALSAGTYYYVITVQFEELAPISLPFSYKGWVELIR